LGHYHLHNGNKFAVVTIEYFTRWIEAKLLATVTSESMKKFFRQNIICRFGVPRTLTMDNGKQFDLDKFKEFCKSLGTTLAFALVYHPESNGAVERANKIVFSVISKTMFNLHKGKWVEELPKWYGLKTPLHPRQQALHYSSSYMERNKCYPKKPSITASR
jgi:IS30 family transposase